MFTTYRSYCVRCFVGVAVLSWQFPVVAQKLAPRRNPAATVAPATVRVTGPERIQVKAPPAYGVTVRVPSGMQVPEKLKKFLVTDGALANPRLKIDAADQESIDDALENAALHVEIDRPKAFVPTLELSPFNLDARISHLVPEFYTAFPNRGKNVKVAVFDEGSIRGTHQEFQDGMTSRIVLKTTKGTSRHSTHCAGTVGAKGVEADAIGMAVQASIFSYDWDNDTFKLNQDAANFQVSSHSYGPLSGWVRNIPKAGVWNWWGGLNDDEDSRYGKYTDDCSSIDEVLFNHPNLVTFFAAGNDRGTAPLTQPTSHFVVSSNTNSSRIRSRIGGATGLDSISGTGIAKNVICIGAINDIPAGGGGTAIQITNFSGVGPSDDCRVKPDLVANGLQLVSTSNAADDSYVELSGTSMATPTASGIGSLLCELFNDHHTRAPTSAEIKAVLIHTARDGGVAGPDPQYGWGSIDALAAGKLIKGTAGQLVKDPSQNKVAEGPSARKTFKFNATTGPIRATIVWTDPAGVPNGGGIDDATTVLQNDLDLKLISPTGAEFLPFSLDPSNLWNTGTNLPNPARTDRANHVDNVESIVAPTAAGEWKVEVLGFDLKAGTNQSFALAVSGLTPVP